MRLFLVSGHPILAREPLWLNLDKTFTFTLFSLIFSFRHSLPRFSPAGEILLPNYSVSCSAV